MNSLEQFRTTTLAASRAATRMYSTSFHIGTRLLARPFRDPIHSIYGFVRFADEIVDTFHHCDRRALLARYESDTWLAIREGISMNPILHAFQDTVHRHGIDEAHIAAFLRSMTMDLDRTSHDRASYASYVHGSAEAVGLMCLRVFCEGDIARYDQLAPAAMRLGAAFQKVNFLRDLRDDQLRLGRRYFPFTTGPSMSHADKKAIETEIAADLVAGFAGLRRLPQGARLGVYVAFRFYQALFFKISRLPIDGSWNARIRVPSRVKLALLMKGIVRHNLDLL